MEILLSYIRDLHNLSRVKFFLNLVLMISLGLLEGIGVLMILPLLAVAGIIPGGKAGGDWIFGLNQHFQNMGVPLSLPFVLVVYTGIIFGQSWLQRYQAMLSFGIQQDFGVSLSVRLFRAVAYAKWQLVVSKTKSDITNVLISELMRVNIGISFFLQTIATTLITIIQIFLAFMIAPVLTCTVLGGVLVLLVLLRTFFLETGRRGQVVTDLNKEFLFRLTECLNGIKDIKSNGIEPAQVHRFIKTRILMKNNLCGFNRLQTRAEMFNRVGAAIFISGFLFCAIEIFKLNPDQLILISVISARLWPKMASLQTGCLNIHSMLPAFRAVKELEYQCLAAQEDLSEDGNFKRIKLKHGVEFRNVSFCYESTRTHYAIANADFVLPAGTTTALVGVSGSGKSTLVDLLIGLLTPVKGAVLIDGEPLAEHLRCWRKSIGYVPQDPFILNASIRDNLLWACPHASEEELWEALRLAAIDVFVGSLPEGLDTVVGDRGVRISGGERQRIVLARALLRKPSVLVLDEATSSLDSENEKRIQQAIENLQGRLTIVVIAHRLSTIRNADQIIVLEQGRILEKGNYQSLMNNMAGRFHSLACSYTE